MKKGGDSMIELEQLEQLVAVAKWGILSRAAEELHISQPTLTRSMQKLESDLQVTLFTRTKNKVVLNANGELAVERARVVLDQRDDLVQRVRTFDLASRTITVASCAPAPMWDLLPVLSGHFEGMTISSQLVPEPEPLLEGLRKGLYLLVILPYKVEEPELTCVYYESEQLLFSLPQDHPLSGAVGLYLKDLDGETIPLYSHIGMWYELHKQKMPTTRFLLQPKRDDFLALVEASSFPAFTSDLIQRREPKAKNRVFVPILDPEVKKDYYLLCDHRRSPDLAAFLRKIEK